MADTTALSATSAILAAAGSSYGEGSKTPLAATSGSFCACATFTAAALSKVAPTRAAPTTAARDRGGRAVGSDVPHLFGGRGVRAATECRAGRRSAADDDPDASCVADVPAANSHSWGEDQNIAALDAGCAVAGRYRGTAVILGQRSRHADANHRGRESRAPQQTAALPFLPFFFPPSSTCPCAQRSGIPGTCSITL